MSRGPRSTPIAWSEEHSPPPSVHVLAAVDRQGRAGDEARVLIHQERNTASDLAGLPEPTNRDSCDDLAEHFLRHRGDHVRVDVAWSDRVHGDAVARALLRKSLREAVNARLCRRIIDLAVLPGLPVDRADVDDPAVAPPGHALEHGLRHVEATAEVRIHHFLPLLVVHPLHRRIAGDAGIVDEYVDRTEVGFDFLYALLAGLKIGHVPFVSRNSGAFAEFARALVIAGIIGRDFHPHVLQRDADRLADTACSAGDDRHSSHVDLLISSLPGA